MLQSSRQSPLVPCLTFLGWVASSEARQSAGSDQDVPLRLPGLHVSLVRLWGKVRYLLAERALSRQLSSLELPGCYPVDYLLPT